jgi:chromosome segregation ATPase
MSKKAAAALPPETRTPLEIAQAELARAQQQRQALQQEQNRLSSELSALSRSHLTVDEETRRRKTLVEHKAAITAKLNAWDRYGMNVQQAIDHYELVSRQARVEMENHRRTLLNSAEQALHQAEQDFGKSQANLERCQRAFKQAQGQHQALVQAYNTCVASPPAATARTFLMGKPQIELPHLSRAARHFLPQFSHHTCVRITPGAARTPRQHRA